jgi:hypothetical protein
MLLPPDSWPATREIGEQRRSQNYIPGISENRPFRKASSSHGLTITTEKQTPRNGILAVLAVGGRVRFGLLTSSPIAISTTRPPGTSTPSARSSIPHRLTVQLTTTSFALKQQYPHQAPSPHTLLQSSQPPVPRQPSLKSREQTVILAVHHTHSPTNLAWVPRKRLPTGPETHTQARVSQISPPCITCTGSTKTVPLLHS